MFQVGGHSLSVPPDRTELGADACWSLSSARDRNGLRELRDGNIHTFWESNGSGPHTVTVQFPKKVNLSHICLYLDHRGDESYTPEIIAIRLGNSEPELEEVMEATLREPTGWSVLELKPTTLLEHLQIPLSSDPALAPKHLRAIDYMTTFCLQLAVLHNHQAGRDTHIRQMRLFGPREVRPAYALSADNRWNSVKTYGGPPLLLR
eukprot:Selendium_serpulae@DN3578_c0_g1_i1.p3